jgi:hypothetical protein
MNSSAVWPYVPLQRLWLIEYTAIGQGWQVRLDEIVGFEPYEILQSHVISYPNGVFSQGAIEKKTKDAGRVQWRQWMPPPPSPTVQALSWLETTVHATPQQV